MPTNQSTSQYALLLKDNFVSQFMVPTTEKTWEPSCDQIEYYI